MDVISPGKTAKDVVKKRLEVGEVTSVQVNWIGKQELESGVE